MATRDLPRFTKLGSSNVLLQVHAGEDSRFILMPVLSQPVEIVGWKVYDSTTGELITEGDGVPDNGEFSALHLAREFVLDNYYRRTA